MEIKQRQFKLLLSALFCAFLLIYAGTLRAQIKVGATTGVNFNSFGQPGVTLGGNIGAFGRYQILEFLEAQAELKYSLIGGGRHDMIRSLEIEDGSSQLLGGATSVQYLNRSAKFHSIEIPLSVRLSLPEMSESSIVPKFIAGFSYAYIIGAFEQRDGMYDFDTGNQILLSDLKENISADINSSNLSYLLGFALDFALDNGNTFTTEFRYQRGINNLNAVQIADPQVTERLYSQSFSINFAYQIFSF